MVKITSTIWEIELHTEAKHTILRKVYFVGKIIFGKLNYNVDSSQFYNNKDFYQKRAETFVSFCKSKEIKYHIKYGTQKKNNKNTEKIFIKEISKEVPLRHAKQASSKNVTKIFLFCSPEAKQTPSKNAWRDYRPKRNN